jgi:hypothetical protein
MRTAREAIWAIREVHITDEGASLYSKQAVIEETISQGPTGVGFLNRTLPGGPRRFWKSGTGCWFTAAKS